MSTRDTLTSALGRLIGWLDTWRTGAGAYHGYVIHRVETKRMSAIHDTAWTQAAIIRGYANLARASGEARWLEAMRQAADVQASRFEPASGQFRFAGHEDDRFCSLVHCALANCALLAASDLVDAARQRHYRQVAQENVERYWLPRLWVEDEGAFRFSETDFISPHEHRFVLNFNTMALECLLALADRTGTAAYRARARRIGDWLLAKCRHTRDVFARLPAPAGGQPMPPGGLPYQFTPTQQQPENCVTLYAGLALRGLVALYRDTGDPEAATVIRDTAAFLLRMRDPETRLFYHTTRGGAIQPYPQFVAGAGMTLLGLLEAAELAGPDALADDTLTALLAQQYANGAFPSFIGKNRTGGRGGQGVVWEDVVAGVNWNAQLFEYLTRRVPEPRAVASVPSVQPVRVATSRFLYVETPASVLIASWAPFPSAGCYWMRKRARRAALACYPRYALSQVARRVLRRGRGGTPA